MKKTCAYCNFHIWSDHLFTHVCQLKMDVMPREQDLDDTCDRWKERQTGKIGCLEHQHCTWDTEEVEGKVKDDKYTRRKS